MDKYNEPTRQAINNLKCNNNSTSNSYYWVNRKQSENDLIKNVFQTQKKIWTVTQQTTHLSEGRSTHMRCVKMSDYGI